MNNNKKVWTKEKVDLLLELLDKGLTYKEISKKMEFTESSIVNYMHKNNLKYRYNPTNGLIKWSEEMIEDLRSLILSREYNYKQISEILSDKYKKDIQIDSVKVAVYIHLKDVKYIAPEQYWSEEQNNLLKVYISEGKSYEEISRLFNKEKSAFAVREQCIRLGIFQPKIKALTEDEEFDIANLFHLGARTPYIIKKYNGEISESRIRLIAKRYNMARLTPEQQANLGYRQGIYYGIKKDEIISLAEQGYSQERIIKFYKVKPHVLKWFCDKFKISLSAIRFKKSRTFVLKKVLGRDPTEDEIKEVENKPISDIIGKSLLIKTLEDNYLCVDRVAAFFDVDSTVIFGAISKFNINLDDLIINIDGNDFLSGFRSYGEYCTACALVMLSLNYNKEYMIKVPSYIRQSGIAKIDFYLTYNGRVFWIEYNGEQHYHKLAGGTIFSEFFEDRVKRDLYVKKRAKENNVTFIEIPYTYYSTKKIQNLLQRVIINGEDINNIIDYTPFYKEIEELGISTDDESESE